MNRLHYICFVILLLLFHLPIFSQNAEQASKEVYSLYSNGDFDLALDKGREWLKLFPHDPSLLFYAGESARRLRYYPTAEVFLDQIPDSAKKGSLSETDFFIGQTKKSLGKYAEAIRLFYKYLDAYSDEGDILTHLAKDEINHCEWIVGKLKENTNDLFAVHSLNDNINSEYSETAPLRYADKIYFTAIYPDDENKVSVSRIYSAIKDHKARLETFNPTTDDLHAAHISLMPDASKMFYTICEEVEGSDKLRCEIWSRDRMYAGGWGPPVKLPKHINFRDATMLHPTVGWDMFLKSYVLYFATDREGGEGGLDIWGSVIDNNGRFAEPFNAPFNSPQDEVTPFFHMPSQTIFFSSDGFPGVGGFDVFRVTKVGEAQWELPVNMGEPLNTVSDEYYYSYHTRTGKAYFASNRNCQRRNPNKENCQTDIFDATIYAELRLRAYNGANETKLALPNITIMDINQGTVQVLAPDPSGQYFSCQVAADRLHHLAVFADGYRPARVIVSTKNLPYSEVVKKEVYLFEGEATAQEQEEMDQYFDKAAVGSGNAEIESLRARVNSKIKP
ncbi:MAG: hypothetical protein AAFZ15_18845 [Bacteroidota bacterium]